MSIHISVERETSLHATLVDVWGRGVLLCGAPGSGKSRLALALVTRGHRLVADDLVLLRDSRDGTHLIGRGVPGWQGKLALRDAGVIDLHDTYGGEASQTECRIAAAITLNPANNTEKAHNDEKEALVLGTWQVAMLRLRPDSPARLALAVEVWAHQHGADAALAFPTPTVARGQA